MESIIRGTKAQLEESTISKFNYYGKRYRFEEELERLEKSRRAVEVPKADPKMACKTVGTFE